MRLSLRLLSALQVLFRFLDFCGKVEGGGGGKDKGAAGRILFFSKSRISFFICDPWTTFLE